MQLACFDAGVDPPDREPVDVSSSISKSCAQFAPLMEGKKLRLYFRGVPCTVYAGANHLDRLWSTVIENAVRYTPIGGSILIATDMLDDGRIRFYRADKARSRADGGTGLGLAIAHELADLYGATIDVQSQPGKGTSFAITFPPQAHFESMSGQPAGSHISSAVS
jgi:two-component system phosphate regulon sensor histidine kinase PhoR